MLEEEPPTSSCHSGLHLQRGAQKVQRLTGKSARSPDPECTLVYHYIPVYPTVFDLPQPDYRSHNSHSIPHQQVSSFRPAAHTVMLAMYTVMPRMQRCEAIYKQSPPETVEQEHHYYAMYAQQKKTSIAAWQA